MIAAVYADGGVVLKNPSPIGGTWAYLYVDENDQVVYLDSGCIHAAKDRLITNNHSEFYALVQALHNLPTGWSGKAYSDSGVSLGRLRDGWKLTGLPTALINYGAEALHKVGEVEYILLDGHPTKVELATGIGKRGHPVSKFNVQCDSMCSALAKVMLADWKDAEEARKHQAEWLALIERKKQEREATTS